MPSKLLFAVKYIECHFLVELKKKNFFILFLILPVILNMKEISNTSANRGEYILNIEFNDNDEKNDDLLKLL